MKLEGTIKIRKDGITRPEVLTFSLDLIDGKPVYTGMTAVGQAVGEAEAAVALMWQGVGMEVIRRMFRAKEK